MKQISNQSSLVQLCLFASAKYKNRPAFAMLSEGRICRSITYKQMGDFSRRLGSLLKRMGVEKGGKVLLLSDNCPEWAVAYFGIAFAEAVSVPLLTGFSIEQIQNIAVHSNVTAVCLSRSISEKITKLKVFSNLPFFYIDTIKEAGNSNVEILISLNGDEQKALMPSPCPVLNEDNDSGNDNSNKDCASIIYTSGTQGNSKGVMLSSKNLISCALASSSFINILSKDRFLSVLPLAHSYECTLGFLVPVISGASITYLDKPPSPSILLPALKLLRPTAMTSVPLLIEKIYNNAILPKLNASKFYKWRLTRLLAIRIAGRKLYSSLGGKLRFFGIGGAPLNTEVEKFLYDAKFPYAIGYGLTEAAPLVAGNGPFKFKIRSGLKPTKGVDIRIEKVDANIGAASHQEVIDVGEIQVYGPNVMLGYYKDKEQTTETITNDGWLRTGDLGFIDKKGKLHIRGRIKALILGPSGENIYPEEIESILGSSSLVEDALVYSSEKGELIALVRLNEAAKAAAGATKQAIEDLRTWVNKKLAVFSRLNRIDIKTEPFEKTPTMKIKRYLYF